MEDFVGFEDSNGPVGQAFVTFILDRNPVLSLFGHRGLTWCEGWRERAASVHGIMEEPEALLLFLKLQFGFF